MSRGDHNEYLSDDRGFINTRTWDLRGFWHQAHAAPGPEIVVLEDPEYTAARARRAARLKARHARDLAWIKDPANQRHLDWCLRGTDQVQAGKEVVVHVPTDNLREW